MYFIRLFKEIFNWISVYLIVYKYEKPLAEAGLRMDWIGRLYTVINIPEEYAANEMTRQAQLIANLRKFDVILLKYGLTELLFPDIEQLEDSYSYLVVLRPEREELFFIKFVKNFFMYFIVYLILKILYVLLIKNTNIVNIALQFIYENVL